jgi:hypothetical protein
MMAEFTVSYSIEGASGGYLTGARYFDETYTLPARTSVDTLRSIARDRVRGERMPTATMKDRDGQPVTLYSWL